MTTLHVLKDKLKAVDKLIEYKLNRNDMWQKEMDNNNKEVKKLLEDRAELTSQIRASARKGK